MLGPWREKMKARINGRSQTKDTPPPKKKKAWGFFFFLSSNTQRECNNAYYELGLRAVRVGRRSFASENWEEKVEKRNKTHATTFLCPGSSAVSGDLCRGP